MSAAPTQVLESLPSNSFSYLFKFEVYQRHIDAGEQNHGKRCPVALAFTEATGYDVFVDEPYMLVRGFLADNPNRIFLNRVIRRWIERYDTGRHVNPITVFVRLPVAMIVPNPHPYVPPQEQEHEQNLELGVPA